MCNYYDKQINNGWISKFKYHIVGGDINVAKCKKVPEKVWQYLKNRMSEKSKQKS